MWGLSQLFRDLANIPSQRSQDQPMELGRTPHGLNTYDPADRISSSEASDLVNWLIVKGGNRKTRLPVIQYTTVAAANGIVHTHNANIGGTQYILSVDSADKLYYLDSLEQTLIGTLEGEATIISFNGVAVIFDGSYIKYLDDVSTIKIAYDDGTGSSGFQFDNSALTNNASLALGNGTILGVSQKFTTQTWTAGYTIPPTSVSAYLSENNSAPAGAITARIRDVVDSSIILASKTFVADASTIGGTASQFSVTFSASDITTELSPATDYFMSLEYSAGDASNYVKVHCNTVASGGLSYYGDTDLDVIGNWNLDSTKNTLMALSPGKPPKGKFGVIWNKRLWAGGNPDNLGKWNFSNLTHLDWSTPNGGGSLGVIDDDTNNFEIGAGIAFYGQLYTFGTQKQPYLVKISGTEPDDYLQEQTFRKPWATHKNVKSALNDVWYFNREGVTPLSGVHEYGDLRSYTASSPVFDRIEKYWGTNTITGYYPEDGQIWASIPGYHRVLVAHSKLGIVGPDGMSTRYPWTEYELYKYELTSDTYKWVANGDEWYAQVAAGGDPSIVSQPDFVVMDDKVLTEGTAGALKDHQWDYALDPTSTYYTIYISDTSGSPDTSGVEIRTIFLPTWYEDTNENFLMGSSDGHLYTLSTTEYKDQTNIQIKPTWGSSYIEMPLGYANISKTQLLASSEGGGRMTVEFYVDGAYLDSVEEVTFTMDVKDSLTLDELAMELDDALFTLEPRQSALFEYINFNARSIRIVIKDVLISGLPIYDNGMLLRFRRLSE